MSPLQIPIRLRLTLSVLTSVGIYGLLSTGFQKNIAGLEINNKKIENIEIKNENEQVLSGSGEVVGKLNNATVRRYKIKRYHDFDHWLYVIDNNPTITINKTNGKNNKNIIVILDEQKYTLMPESEQ